MFPSCLFAMGATWNRWSSHKIKITYLEQNFCIMDSYIKSSPEDIVYFNELLILHAKDDI